MDKHELKAVVLRAQSGDSHAIEELYTAFYESVFYFAKKTLRDENLAYDITQDTFLEVIRTIDCLEAPEAFAVWIRRITLHQCTRHFKKKKDVLLEEDADGHTILDTMEDDDEGSLPAEVCEKEEFRSTILSIVDTLSEEQRAAVLLYYYDELPIQKIAEMQGVSEGTVKSRLNYARKAIRKGVEQYEAKTGTKLHGVPFLPLVRIFFNNPEPMSSARAAALGKTISAAAGTVAAGAASVGIAAKIVAIPLGAKIVSLILAVAITVGICVTVVTVSKDAPTGSAEIESTVAEADTFEATPDTDASVPETDMPETDAPETDVPETDVPETDVPETDAPETDVPETDAPETDVAKDTSSLDENSSQVLPTCLSTHVAPTLSIEDDILTIRNNSWEFEESNIARTAYHIFVDGNLLYVWNESIGMLCDSVVITDTFRLPLMHYSATDPLGAHTITVQPACVQYDAEHSVFCNHIYNNGTDGLSESIEYTRSVAALYYPDDEDFSVPYYCEHASISIKIIPQHGHGRRCDNCSLMSDIELCKDDDFNSICDVCETCMHLYREVTNEAIDGVLHHAYRCTNCHTDGLSEERCYDDDYDGACDICDQRLE